MNGSTSEIKQTLWALVLLSAGIAVVANVDGNPPDSAGVSNVHVKLTCRLDHSVTNRLAEAVERIKSPTRTNRLSAVSDLFVCSLVDPALMKRQKVGDEVLAAYTGETVIEIRMAMLATLDVLGHPALSNLLLEAERSDDPMVKNLAVLIREKRYLEPVVSRTPKFPPPNKVQQR
jgi:hypothetical protein